MVAALFLLQESPVLPSSSAGRSLGLAVSPSTRLFTCRGVERPPQSRGMDPLEVRDVSLPPQTGRVLRRGRGRGGRLSEEERSRSPPESSVPQFNAKKLWRVPWDSLMRRSQPSNAFHMVRAPRSARRRRRWGLPPVSPHVGGPGPGPPLGPSCQPALCFHVDKHSADTLRKPSRKRKVPAPGYLNPEKHRPAGEESR